MSAAEVWLADIGVSPDRLDLCASILEDGERARADRFVRAADRARYVVSHAALRLLLAERLCLDPVEIRYTTGLNGKPDLAGTARGELAFNLSHSGARALIGLTPGTAIGVDVEVLRPLPDAVRIARAHFADDEVATLTALAPEVLETAFYGLWTRKEAVVKALGTGLSLPLNRFSVTVPPALPRLLRGAPGNAPGRGWTLESVDLGPGYAATVAIRSADAAIRCHTLPTDWPDRLG